MATFAPTMDEVAFSERWLAIIQRDHPDVPTPILEAFFAADGMPTSEALAEVLGCAPAAAETWRRYLGFGQDACRKVP